MTTRQPDLLDSPGARDAGSPASSRLPGLLRAGALVALVTLAAGYAVQEYSEGQPTRYSATSQVVLSSSTNFSPIDATFSNSSPDRYVENQSAIMTTTDVVDRAAAALADGVPGSELRDDVSAAPAGASDVIVVTAEADDPALAARRADAVANAYAQFTTAQVNALADQAVAASPEDPVQVQQIRARAATFGDGVQVIQPATVPDVPSSPTPRRDAYLAAVAALLLSLGLVLGLNGLRRRGNSPSELAAQVGSPLLGSVPVRWPGRFGSSRQPGRAHYAMALQALRYRQHGSGDVSVLVTDVGRGSGAGKVLLGLAAAHADQGHQVVLVDATADGRLFRLAGMRRPALPPTTGPRAAHGVAGAPVAVPALAGPGGGGVRIVQLDRSAGGAALHTALAGLGDAADLVLVDAGPAAEDAAAFALVDHVGAVVAAVPARQRSADGEELRERLAQAGRSCAGTIVMRRSLLPSLSRPPAAAASRRPADAVPMPPAVPTPEPPAAEQLRTQPAAEQPSVSPPAAEQLRTQPAAEQPSVSPPADEQPRTQPTAEQPSVSPPADEQPRTQPTAEQPSVSPPADEQPRTQPTAEQPSVSPPADEQPGPEPAADELPRDAAQPGRDQPDPVGNGQRVADASPVPSATAAELEIAQEDERQEGATAAREVAVGTSAAELPR